MSLTSDVIDRAGLQSSSGQALDALEWRWGPCHLELMLTSRGPRLVECNMGRWNGIHFRRLADACVRRSRPPLATPCPLPAHCLPSRCPLPARSLPTPCPLAAHSLPARCPLPARSLPAPCPLAAHSLRLPRLSITRRRMIEPVTAGRPQRLPGSGRCPPPLWDSLGASARRATAHAAVGGASRPSGRLR